MGKILPISIIFILGLCDVWPGVLTIPDTQITKSSIPFPIPIVLRVDGNGKVIDILNKIPNTESVVNLNERLWFRCTAPYPVQWIYSGNGAPDIVTAASKQKTTDNYQADLRIGRSLEKHTGQYVCRSTEDPNISTYFYIYVPGSDLFTAAQGKEVLYSSEDMNITIPCTVSHKDASVILQKSVEDVLQDPLELRDPYVPRVGFRLRVSDVKDLPGVYVCSATSGNTLRLMEYIVMQKDSINRANLKSCTPSPCGQNSKCQILGSNVVCSCRSDFLGDPYTSCEKPCTENLDCPEDFFCNSKKKMCEDPCKDYACDFSVAECKVTSHFPGCVQSTRVREQPCGKNSCPSGTVCKRVNREYKCVCAKDFLGPNPEMGCYAQCQNSADCNSVRTCDYPICVDPCTKFNPCGINANCVPKNHERICQCKQGFTGQPYQMCFRIPATTTPTPRMKVNNAANSSSSYSVDTACGSCGPRSSCNLANGKFVCTCKVGYLGRPPKCRPSCSGNDTCDSKLSCVMGRCVDPCAQNISCGLNAECIAEDHKAICKCASGHAGDPKVACRSVPSVNEPVDISPRCSGNFCRRRPISIISNVASRLGLLDDSYK